MSTSVHAVAQQGFGTGTNDLYDRARPSYQSNAISHIRQAVKAAGAINVVELGAGTGIFTRALLAHSEWKDALARIRAVEPSAGMRAAFERTVEDPRADIVDGSFAATGVEDGWADVVIIAQAFHWCPDYEAAAKELARVLKPNGVVALIWNLEDRETAAWVAQLRDLIESHENNTPQFHRGLWRAFFGVPSYAALFKPEQQATWDYTLPATLEVVTDRAHSKSYIAILGEEQRRGVDAEITKIIGRGDGLVWRDEAKGEFEYPYKTTVVICEKKA
ncbi:S-adenosyl-L-methionine-dependent methyltransferase [Athelia psychrophila]|uniref:S-adenosyl-L-methionine-dependent methyltransferase n=1 Tax=Athelia psychrophila TaxID=1759441 RepID=A0A166ATT1_9AGAM|nr:S-adenosyl-L-methionine-dependent methyltransferase [Fibularhizoctonia sp. CBS 109695]